MNDHAQAPDGGAVEEDAAAVAQDDVLRDGHAETETAGLFAAAAFEAEEGFEDIFVIGRIDARAVIIHGQTRPAVMVVGPQSDFGAGCVFAGVLDKIGECAFQRVGADFKDQ